MLIDWLILCLINDAFNLVDHMSWKGRMMHEWWIEKDMEGRNCTCVKALSRLLPLVTERSNEIPQSGQMVSRQRFQTRTSRRIGKIARSSLDNIWWYNRTSKPETRAETECSEVKQFRRYFGAKNYRLIWKNDRNIILFKNFVCVLHTPLISSDLVTVKIIITQMSQSDITTLGLILLPLFGAVDRVWALMADILNFLNRKNLTMILCGHLSNMP
jgi:hypothetical protein